FHIWKVAAERIMAGRDVVKAKIVIPSLMGVPHGWEFARAESLLVGGLMFVVEITERRLGYHGMNALNLIASIYRRIDPISTQGDRHHIHLLRIDGGPVATHFPQLPTPDCLWIS